jgi:hypothetical protein
MARIRAFDWLAKLLALSARITKTQITGGAIGHGILPKPEIFHRIHYPLNPEPRNPKP